MPTKQPDGGYYRYTKNNQTLPTMPAMGKNKLHGIQLTQFEPKNGNREYKINRYNDEYNATLAHEEQHNINANPGPDVDNPTNLNQLGQSYDLMFAEKCWDEIIANIKQCLQQRQNYLVDNDLKRITSRFRPYATAVASGNIKPTKGNISQSEGRFIAETVFSGWMKESFLIYYQRLMSQIKEIHESPNANWNALQKDKKRHLRALIDKMHIRDKDLGIDFDFFPYLYTHENEILSRIKPEDKQEFEKLVAIKKKNRSHLEDLEWQQKTEGRDEYLNRIDRNVRVAKINQEINHMKDRFSKIKQNFGR